MGQSFCSGLCVESLPSHICLTVYPYNLGKPDNVAKPPKRSLAEHAAARARRANPRARTPAPSSRPIDGRIFHPPWTSVQGSIRVLSRSSRAHPRGRISSIQRAPPRPSSACVGDYHASNATCIRTRRAYERVPVNFPSSHIAPSSSNTNCEPVDIDAVDARARSNKRSRREWKEWNDPPPPGHERPVAGRPAIDRHRERVKEKKYATAVAFVPCSHVKVRSGAGWVRFGCGKVRRGSRGSSRDVGWRPLHTQILNMEEVLSF